MDLCSEYMGMLSVLGLEHLVSDGLHYDFY